MRAVVRARGRGGRRRNAERKADLRGEVVARADHHHPGRQTKVCERSHPDRILEEVAAAATPLASSAVVSARTTRGAGLIGGRVDGLLQRADFGVGKVPDLAGAEAVVA